MAIHPHDTYNHRVLVLNTYLEITERIGDQPEVLHKKISQDVNKTLQKILCEKLWFTVKIPSNFS